MAEQWSPPAPQEYLARWRLVPDGAAFSTPSSHLQPVRFEGQPAMLKVSRIDEERNGARLMRWWSGRGAARVLAFDDDAVVLERALGPRSLFAMATTAVGSNLWASADDEASRALRSVAAKLHGIDTADRPADLIPLTRWFRDLLNNSPGADPFILRSAAIARELLADQQQIVVLHGDLHHRNVLDFGDGRSADWLAIDPKFLIGDRAFDFANIFCNPLHAVALQPGRLARQVDVVSKAAGLDRERLLRWIVAWTGLSATWFRAGDAVMSTPGADGAASAIKLGQIAEGMLAS
jgi:streptomycin 6-kinase